MTARACGFDMGRCRRPVTVAMRVGDHPTDTLACEDHAAKVRDHQASLGVPVTSRPATDADMAPRSCGAQWRTHGCALRPAHGGEHECDCGDRPTPRDEVSVARRERGVRPSPVPRHWIEVAITAAGIAPTLVCEDPALCAAVAVGPDVPDPGTCSVADWTGDGVEALTVWPEARRDVVGRVEVSVAHREPGGRPSLVPRAGDPTD